MTRVLNLYAGVGGNRALWPQEADVTAVEKDPEIAEAYAALWPDDELVVGDAHQYLLDHLGDGWDLIWSSPPCQSHSKLNRLLGRGKHRKLRYPKFGQLYGEVVVLTEFRRDVPWVVENVKPYYEVLIPPTTIMDRHLMWSNIGLPYIAPRPEETTRVSKNGKQLSRMKSLDVDNWEALYGLTLPTCADSWGRGKRRQVMRNCVDPKIGLAVWDAAFRRDRMEQDTLLGVEL